MGAIPLIHNAGLRIVPHSARSHEVPRIGGLFERTRIKPDLLGARFLQDFSLTLSQKLDGLHVVRMILERDAQSRQTPGVLHLFVERDALLLSRETRAVSQDAGLSRVVVTGVAFPLRPPIPRA